MLIQDYNPKWKQDFQQIKGIIQNTLRGLPIRIEHIGSTAVPGLSSKPIIDIDIVYSNREEFSEIKERLAQIGYYHNGDQGVPHREAFKRNDDIKIHPILDNIYHHLYACPADSDELKKHILFRDFLIKNNWAKKEYQSLKLKIAKETNQDRKSYVKLKEVKAKDFILNIIELAKCLQT